MYPVTFIHIPSFSTTSNLSGYGSKGRPQLYVPTLLDFLIGSYYSPVLLAKISYVDYLTPLVSVKIQILTNIA